MPIGWYNQGSRAIAQMETPLSIVDLVSSFLDTLPFKLDPFQEEAIQALAVGRSVLVSAPTGTGKTVIAEFAIHRALERGTRAIYTAPIKALSNQKFRNFRSRYGALVGLLTGDLVENPAGRLLVMTTEIARNMLVQDPSSFIDVGCLIFDEVHYLADPERGTAWEESILLAPLHLPLVCLSATVANAEEIADWIRSTGRDVALVRSDRRAVPLVHRFFLDGALHPIAEGNSPKLPESHVAGRSKGGTKRSSRTDPAVERRPRRDGARSQPNQPIPRGRDSSSNDLEPQPAEVVRSLSEANLLPAIYFMFSRRATEEAAESCQGLDLLDPPRSAEIAVLARERLAELPPEDRALPQVERLLAILPRGLAFHHAGLLPPLKVLVEELLASGRLRVVFATDTLALGINVPARSVVVGEIMKFDGQIRRPLAPGEYRQLTGRAGRRGMDPVGYSILLPSPWAGPDRVMEIALGDVAPLESAFRPGYSTVLTLLQQPGGEERLASLISGSLRRFQEDARVRSLAREHQSLSDALSALPRGCPLDGGTVDWLDQERRLRREEERAQSALDAAEREMATLESRISAWPWRHTKGQRKSWVAAARPGEMAYSRRWGWVAYLGPASHGIGLFLTGVEVVTMSSHADLDYLPSPALQADIPADIRDRCSELDGALHLTAEQLARAAVAVRRLVLLDVEQEASRILERLRAENAELMRNIEGRQELAAERLRSASLALAQLPCRSCPIRSTHRRMERERRSLEGLIASTEHELEQARADSRRRAHRTLASMTSVLRALGYLDGRTPTPKARMVEQIFDSNALVIAELLDSGVLSDASPAEVAETASWFAFDRQGSCRPLSTTERLARIRAAAEGFANRVQDVERRHGLSLSGPLAPGFRGVVLAWATGSPLSDVSSRSGLAEGDIVFMLQKTIDLCGQLHQAAVHSRTPSVAARAREAQNLLRRGVVDGYYRWVVGQPAG